MDGVHINSPCFAEDVPLVMNGMDATRRALEVAERHARVNRYTWSVSKSVNALTTRLTGMPIPIQDSTKYLGGKFHGSGMDFNAHLERLASTG